MTNMAFHWFWKKPVNHTANLIVAMEDIEMQWTNNNKCTHIDVHVRLFKKIISRSESLNLYIGLEKASYTWCFIVVYSTRKIMLVYLSVVFSPSREFFAHKLKLPLSLKGCNIYTYALCLWFWTCKELYLASGLPNMQNSVKILCHVWGLSKFRQSCVKHFIQWHSIEWNSIGIKYGINSIAWTSSVFVAEKIQICLNYLQKLGLLSIELQHSDRHNA